jgi:hypothetical protein
VYWLKKSKEAVEVAEAVIKMLQKSDGSISANFRRGFIGIRVALRLKTYTSFPIAS